MRQFPDDDDDDEIFNADETALFKKLILDGILQFKDENCTGSKLSTDRITVAVNFNGAEKLLVKNRNIAAVSNRYQSIMQTTVKFG